MRGGGVFGPFKFDREVFGPFGFDGGGGVFASFGFDGGSSASLDLMGGLWPHWISQGSSAPLD